MPSSVRQSSRVFRLICCATLFVCSADTLHAQNIRSQIQSALRLDAHDPTVFGVLAIELPGGRQIYSDRAQTAFKPASNMKLVTTAAAIDLLGPAFEFRTAGFRIGDDLVVLGGGDPLIAHPRVTSYDEHDRFTVLYDWADQLRTRGITSVPGDLIIDDSVFDVEWTHPSWPANQLDKHYSAPVGGLNLHGNCIQAIVYPKAGPTRMADYLLVPTNPFIQIENRCRVAGGGQPWMSRKGDGPEFLLAGRCNQEAMVGLVTVADPGLFFGTTLRTYFAAKGIRVSGSVRRGSLRERRAADVRSSRPGFEHATGLQAVLTEANARSLNLAAECLMKMIGRQAAIESGDLRRSGSWTGGRRAITAYLDRLGLDVSALVIDDGSGLSHDNRMTPAALTGVLSRMFNGPHREMYLHSLARSGMEGTLRKRMRDLPGRFYGKTGYIDGVRALSGYLQTDDGGWIALSILHNGFKGSSVKYREAQEKVVRILSGYRPGPVLSQKSDTAALAGSSAAQ